MHTYGCFNGTIGDASILALDGGVGSGGTCNSTSVSSCSVTLTTTQSNDVIVVYCVDGTGGGTFSTPTAAGLTFTPVSYTHLDVYKRQLLTCSL